MISSEEWHRGEGVPVIVIAQGELPICIMPTGEHRAVLCQDHRVDASSNHLLGDLAVREGRHRGEGVPVRVIAQAELPIVIPPTGEHRAVLCQDHRVLAASNHLLGDLAFREGRHRGEGVSANVIAQAELPTCLLYTSPSPRDLSTSRMPSSA